MRRKEDGGEEKERKAADKNLSEENSGQGKRGGGEGKIEGLGPFDWGVSQLLVHPHKVKSTHHINHKSTPRKPL